MTQKFVTYGQSDDNIDHVNAWYRNCQARKVPYVTIRTRRKFADVQWDYINLPKEIDDVIRTKNKDFSQGFIDIFMRHANQKSAYRVGPFVVEFTDVDVSLAPKIAEEMYDYVSAELNLA